MSMRNEHAPHVDFGFLKGAIPQNEKILPSNIDMAYGIRGNFLFGEWKRPGEDMLEGQKILLRFLSEAKKTNVLLIEGFSNKTDTQVFAIYRIKNSKIKLIGHGIKDLLSIIRDWSVTFTINNPL